MSDAAPAGAGDPGSPAVLAVDGGGTKTDVALVAASGALVGRARGAPSNHQKLEVEGAMGAIDATVRAALEDAGRSPDARPVCATGVYCLAGIDLPIDEARVSAAVREAHWTTRDLVMNDLFAVMRAGSTTGWGVGVVCGTGLNCVARAPDGRTVRFPSLGELSGDLAPGGAWLGVRGLGLAMRASDGRGAPSALEAAVPAHFGLASPDAVLEAVYGRELHYSELFELAPIVLEAAAAGDAPARGAVDELADEVVAMVTASVRRLALADEPVEVVLGGGIVDAREPGFLARVETGIRAVAPGAVLRFLADPPVLGAALLGLDALGDGGVAPGVEARLRAAFAASAG